MSRGKGVVRIMNNRKELSKKIVRTLLAMSVVYSGGVLVADSMASAATITTPQNFDYNSTYSNQNYSCNSVTYGKAQVFDADLDIEVSETGKGALSLVMSSNNSESLALITKGDVRLKAAAGAYALLAGSPNSGSSRNIIVNLDGDKTVQIIGDVGLLRSYDDGILLNLASADSYWAGKLVAEIDSPYYTNTFDFRLSNQAVWYAGQDSFNENNLGTISLTSDGGIIDLYHSQPGVARADTGSARTFTLNGITDDAGGSSGTTFRIGSNIAEEWSDKVVLNGADSYNGSNTYNIQIVADPSISSSASVIDVAAKKIVVAQIDGTKITQDKITILGSKYEGAEVAAGLMYADVTPEVEYDSTAASGTGGYIIKQLTAENFRAINDGGKASALTLAEVGASTALNMASAWRAENNDLLRRMGDLRNSSDEAGVWVRMYGGKNEVVEGQQTDMDYKAVQGGYDYQSNLKNGRLFTGFTVSRLDGDVSGSRTDGDINSTMFGLYGSYVGDKGHFADLIVKYGRINSDFNTLKGGNRYGSDYGSNGFSITTEYGYRQNLKNNFYIEPQAELTYSRIGGSDYTMSLNDGDGAKVSNDAFNSLIGRVGFTVGRQQEQSNVYAKLSLAREFKGEVATSASYGDVTRSYASGGSDTWLEYGIGFNSKLSKGTNLYGEIEKTTGSIIKTKWRANVGLRYSF
jgi:outer membrane autotransporter protein